jgi:tRNA dimethylallyltransferase
MQRAHVIAIFGPTGVGKTAVALSLAARLRVRGEDPVAVSADALQVYRGLETLTGAASAPEHGELEHRLISFLPVTEGFSAGRYAQLAHSEIDGLLVAGRRPIVVGGTGLYLRAALAELSLQPPPPPGVRERIAAELDRDGPAALHARLAARDPQAAERIAPSDRQRIIRALELLELDGGVVPARGPVTGGSVPSTGPDRSGEPAPSELWTEATRHPTLLVGLTLTREQLYAQIDARVEQMVAAGAAEEVRRADALGAGPTARKALGFQELLAGDVEAMKLHTRQYARRQLTWMRKLPAAHVFDATGRSADQLAAEIITRWDR